MDPQERAPLGCGKPEKRLPGRDHEGAHLSRTPILLLLLTAACNTQDKGDTGDTLDTSQDTGETSSDTAVTGSHTDTALPDTDSGLETGLETGTWTGSGETFRSNSFSNGAWSGGRYSWRYAGSSREATITGTLGTLSIDSSNAVASLYKSTNGSFSLFKN